MKLVWHRYFTVSISCELLRWVLTGSPRNFGNFLLLCFERNKCLCWGTWAGLRAQGCHSHAGKEGLKIRTQWPQCHLRLSNMGTSLQARKNCVCLGSHKPLWALLLTCSHPRVQQSGLQLGSSGISTPAINKSNWMFEAFLTWHQGTPSGFVCLLGKQRVWPHAALSHRTASLPLILAHP